MKESVALAKDADAKKDFSSTRSDNSIHRVRNEPERQLGSLRGVINNIRHDGGTPSLDSIATELRSMHTAQRASVLLALQRTHGNRYVQRVVAGIQAKLKVGQPGDVYEQEADRVAEQVMRMPEPEVQRQEEEKEEEEELIQTKLLAEQITLFVQRQVEEEDEEKKKKKEEEEEILQTKEVSGQTPEVASDFESRIQSLGGGGQPLPESVRTFFEPRFGYDFSQVQVHTDGHAAGLARSVNARAFTRGKDIIFGGGQYAPETSSGKKLLAHELTHVVQQTGLTYAIKVSHSAQVVKGKQAVSRLTGSFSWSPQLQRVKESRVSTRRFRGPVGRLIDPSLIRGVKKATSIMHVSIGGAWPEGYPLVPGVYDGFLNFTFIVNSYNAVVVEREGQYLEIPLNNIRQYVRFTPPGKGVWSSRWFAIAYPGAIKKIGDVLMLTGVPVAILIGMGLVRMGEEGLGEAAEAGILEARELLEEQEEEPELIAVVGRLKGCNLDNTALVDLEKHGGATAREIGIQKKLFTTEAARKEFSTKGNWPELKRKFNIKVLPKTPEYIRWFKEAKKLGLKEMDARILAGSRANNLPLVTSDPHFLKAANKLKVVVRFFRPYIPRPGAPRRLPIPKERIPRIRIR